jgi:hypothetical protein
MPGLKLCRFAGFYAVVKIIASLWKEFSAACESCFLSARGREGITRTAETAIKGLMMCK